MTTTILGLGGSLRPGSTTNLALQVALSAAEAAGAHIQHYDLAHFRLPFFNGTYTLNGYEPAEQDAIRSFIETVSAAHGFILASPTYHNTLSGALKNALDILEIHKDEGPARFRGKVVGLMTVQGGTSGTGNNALTTMLLAARGMGAWVAPTMVSVPGSRDAFDETGVPRNAAFATRLRMLGDEVARASAMFAAHWRVS